MKCVYCGHEWESEQNDILCPRCSHSLEPATPAELAYCAATAAEEETRYEDAMELYAKAADGGIPCASYGVCRCLDKSGQRKIQSDLYEFWLSTAALWDGHGAYKYSKYLKRAGADREAVYHLRRSADMGYLPANFSVAWYYLKNGNRYATRYFLKQGEGADIRCKILLYLLGKNGTAYAAEMPETADHTVEYYSAGTYAEAKGLGNIAKSYFELAAQSNYVPALEKLADICMQGAEREEANAEKYLNLLGTLGSADAYVKLGDYYKNGLIGGTPSVEKAYEMYLKAAKAGDSRAMVLVGDACFEGVGTERDTFAALSWYDKATRAGNPLGESRGKATRKEGEKLYIQGAIATEDGELESAIALFRQAAELGNANAACTLGDFYFNGRGVKKSYKLAAKWYEFSIVLGKEEVKYRLGMMYATNLGVNFDGKRAEKLLREASLAGCKEAEAAILQLKKQRNARLSRRVYSTACVIYRRGNKRQAIGYLALAVKMGNARAAYMLACMFDCGDYVPRDEVRAKKYYDKARELGFDGKGNRYMGAFIRNLKA